MCVCACNVCWCVWVRVQDVDVCCYCVSSLFLHRCCMRTFLPVKTWKKVLTAYWPHYHEQVTWLPVARAAFYRWLVPGLDCQLTICHSFESSSVMRGVNDIMKLLCSWCPLTWWIDSSCSAQIPSLSQCLCLSVSDDVGVVARKDAQFLNPCFVSSEAVGNLLEFRK